MEIPANYGQWTAIWSQVGVARELACTCGYENFLALDPADVAEEIRLAGTTGVDNVFDVNQFTATLTLERIYVLQNRGGILESGILLVGAQGTVMTDGMTVNTSVVVAKATARAGRQFRGRWEWPSGYVAEASVDQAAEISTVRRDQLQDSFDLFYAGLVSRAIAPVILHSQPKVITDPIPPPTKITTFSVRTQMGSARRRLKRISA